MGGTRPPSNYNLLLKHVTFYRTTARPYRVNTNRLSLLSLAYDRSPTERQNNN